MHLKNLTIYLSMMRPALLAPEKNNTLQNDTSSQLKGKNMKLLAPNKIELIPLTVHRAKSSTDAQTWLFRAKLKAPTNPKKVISRPSVNLAIVIDRSGSMNTACHSGKSALEEAKSAAIAMIHSMADSDRVSIVCYDQDVTMVLPSTPVSEAKFLAGPRLAQVSPGGSTALHAGWLAGAHAIADFVSQYGVSRVILLSDGQANHGVTDEARISAEAAQLNETGIGTSTYGLGAYFNERLMSQMAVGGNACYAEDSVQLEPYFAQEFALLSNTIGQQVRIELSAIDSAGAPLVIKALRCRQVGPGWSLSNLLNDAWSWAIFEVAAPVGAGAVKCSAELFWKDASGKNRSASVSVAQTAAPKAGRAHAEVRERRREVDAAILAEQVADQARRGDYVNLANSLRTMSSTSANNAYLQGFAGNLQAMASAGQMESLVKEATYGASTLSTRQVDAKEDHKILIADRLGLRKAVQGVVSRTKDHDALSDKQ
jgi:Ca-activated chloride channel family protein